MFYKNIIKPLLFSLPAEKAHHLGTSLFKTALSIPVLSSLFRSHYRFDNDSLHKTVVGIDFPSPIGLAAGFDKDGKYYKTMSHLGFGFIEIGTVTPQPQIGNPQPRLFRLKSDRALINRMGFNNEGVTALVNRLKEHKDRKIIIGGNIGKNKVTPNESAISDYEYCFNELYPYVDYFVLNVSSPNTPGLRSLQDKEPLKKLLSTIMNLRNTKKARKPVFLKIAPDLSNTQIDDVLEIIDAESVDGIIATNTTISRAGLNTSEHTIETIGNGGLSGQPLQSRSIEVVKYIRSINATLPIIGVGGICTPQDAVDMLEAGADLIQVYSGMVYEGPDLIKRIKKAISLKSS